MSFIRNFIKIIGIYVPCVTSLLIPREVIASRLEAPHNVSYLKLLLKNPFHFDRDADPMLVDRFQRFHARVDEKWTEHGLRTKVRKLVQSHEPMNAEVFAEIVERAHEALQLRDALELWVAQVGRTSSQGLGTIARFMSEVYVPMLAVQAEGRLFPEVRGLKLTAALWPHFGLGESSLEDFMGDQKPQLRRPAAEMEAGQSASDTEYFLNSVSPLLDERLKAYANSLQQSAQRSSRIAEIQIELERLRASNPNAGGRRVLSPQEREARAKASEDRTKRIAALEQELRRLGNGERLAQIDAEIKKIQRSGGTLQSTVYTPYGATIPLRILSEAERKKIEELRLERARLTPEAQKKEVVEFFAEASKLTTLQLMIKQIQFYQELADVSNPLPMGDIAPACLASYKELTPTLRFQLASKEERLFNMEMFLANNGLLFSESEHLKQEDFENFFLSTKDRDPFKGYYAGLMPFHQVRVAQQGKRYANNEKPQEDWSDLMNPASQPSWQDLGPPSFDDVEHFQDVLSFMLPEATKHLQNEDAEEFNSVISILPPPAIEVEEGDEHYMDFLQAQEWVGLTPYLRDKLMEKGKTRDQWVSIVPKDVLTAITENKISVDFPSFYGSEAYKQWALRLMFRALNQDKVGLEVVSYLCRPVSNSNYVSMSYGAPENIDDSPRFTPDFCRSQSSPKELLMHLKKILRPFEDNGPFVPPALSYAQNLRKDWGNLRSLWNHLKARGDLDNLEGEQGPNMNEYTFIRNQYGANPWVMLRLSVLIKLSELRAAPATTSAASERGRGGAMAPNSAQLQALNQRSRLRKALEALPLADAQKPLRPAYGNSIYTKQDEGWKFWKDQRDKNFYKIWDSIERKYHDNNAHIFRAKVDRSSDWDHYSLMERLETRSLLTQDDVKRVIDEYKLEKRGVDPKEMHELLQYARESDDANKFELIKKIMETPGERAKHEELLQDFIFRQGQEDAFDDPRDIKLAFFRRDASYKFPLMTQVLKIAGMKRTEELKKNMQPLCALNASDEKDWDKLMSMTGETQKMFNSAFGLDGIPPEVIKFYDRGEGGLFGMHPRDVTNMGLMIGGFVGLAIAGGMCASGVGSVAGCPLMVTLLTVSAAGALSYSTADFIIFSVQEAMGREERMRLGNTFEQLGFSNKESVDRMKGRGWWGVAFEVVTAATMFVPIGLAIKVAGRTTIGALLTRAAKLEGLAKPGLETTRTVFEVVDAKAAEVTLRLVEKAPKTGTILSRFFARLREYTKKGNFLHALKKDFADDIVVNASPELLNQQTGKVLADYFNGNKQAFVNFVQRNVGLKFERIEKLILKAEKTGDPKYLAKLEEYFHGMHLKPDRLEHFKAELVKEKRILSGLAADLAKKDGPELAEYLARHADLLAPLLSDFTYHWWRVPGYAVYLVFFQGSPWAYTNKPFAQWLTSRAFVKHVFASREKLMIHYLRRQAQEGLELTSRVAMFNQLSLFQTAENLATRVASNMANSSDQALKNLGDKALTEWKLYRKQIAQRVLDANPDAKLDLAKVERLIFNPTADELEEARALLKKTRPETLFGFQASTENMDRVLMRLSKESRNLDQQADYIALLAQRVKLLNIPIRSHEVLAY
jgi:hypothetical protein